MTQEQKPQPKPEQPQPRKEVLSAYQKSVKERGAVYKKLAQE